MAGAAAVRCRAGAAAGDSPVSPAPLLTLHVYDHCPFCLRAELALGWLGAPYRREVYGYGQGADPEQCGGTGYGPEEGPRKLTGKKILPVLEGEGVPAPAGMRGLLESLEICSYAAVSKRGGGSLAPATGRGDLGRWLEKHKPVYDQLVRPRLIQMPVKDWRDPQDIAYSRWKYITTQGFDYAAAEAATPRLLEEMAGLLEELTPLLRGTTADGVPCLNAWGLSMDDILVLPNLRNLTCVAGLRWPAAVDAYVERACSKAGVALYTAHAC